MALPLTKIKQQIHRYLDQYPSCTEHDLINHLENNSIEPYCELNLKSTNSLFKLHFLTKHVLYKLQEEYAEATCYYLNIELTRIERRPYDAGVSGAAVGTYDSVRDYYLDLTHFYNTSEAEVESMLTDFWEKYLAYQDISSALEILGLSAEANLKDLKVRYRELAQVHHPDRGGNAEKFIAITEAKLALEKVLI